MENKQSDEWLKNLPVRTENPAFKPEEMVACENCRRANPPTRLNCVYCGKPLPVTAEQSKHLKPSRRKLEIFEKGFNLIFAPSWRPVEQTDVPEIAKLLNLETEDVNKIFEAKQALPLARSESEREAEIIKERLQEFGVEAFVLSDEALAADKPPKRLRRVDFEDDKIILILFNQDEIAEIRFENLALIVPGAIFERKVESTEKRKKGESKVLNSTETATDEFLFDLYSRDDADGFRIYAKGFDFSCLGEEKEILAKDNLKKLARKFTELAPDAKLIEDYLAVRESLGDVWEVEERKDSQGLKRESFSRYNLGSVTTVNNSIQFTKYSRLQWHLL